MALHEDIVFVGVNDHDIDLFEGQYRVPDGMSYNSYVILDDEIAVMDTVDARFGEEWLANVAAALAGRTPDYLVVQHMEPDHSANIALFAQTFPSARIVASAKAFAMMKAYFGTDFAERRIVVGDGDALSLGTHELSFVTAPMVHWPEVIMSYDASSATLFSADAFGKFGALDAPVAAQATDGEDWACEARRYYFGIVGKFGRQVQAVLKKASALDIRTVCPLHGPVLTDDLGHYLSLYDTWSSYKPEDHGVTIAYCSLYVHTKQVALTLAQELQAAGVQAVSVFDLARDDMAEAVEDAFRYDRLVLVSTTYNGDMFPFMKEFIHHLIDHAYQNRTIALVESGSWAPTAARAMRTALEGCKDLSFTENTVTIHGALETDAAAKEQLAALVAELAS